MANYRTQAEQMINPGYQNTVSDINAQYDQELQNIRNRVAQTKNNFANNKVASGMARSSMYSTGLAAEDNAGNTDETNLGIEKMRQLMKANNDKESRILEMMNSYRNQGSGGGGGSNNNKQQTQAVGEQTKTYFYKLGTLSDKYDFLSQYKNDIIQNAGQSTYNELQRQYYEELDRLKQEPGTGMGGLKAYLGGY